MPNQYYFSNINVNSTCLQVLILQVRIRDICAGRYLGDHQGRPDYFTGEENQAEAQRD